MQDARGFRMRAENADRLARLHQQRLVVFELAKGAHDGVKRRPIARGAASAAVDDQFVRLFGDLGIEVVHQHPQGGFLMPAFAGNFAPPRRANYAADDHPSLVSYRKGGRKPVT